jgi:hypothetical protein
VSRRVRCQSNKSRRTPIRTVQKDASKSRCANPARTLGSVRQPSDFGPIACLMPQRRVRGRMLGLLVGSIATVSVLDEEVLC